MDFEISIYIENEKLRALFYEIADLLNENIDSYFEDVELIVSIGLRPLPFSDYIKYIIPSNYLSIEVGIDESKFQNLDDTGIKKALSKTIVDFIFHGLSLGLVLDSNNGLNISDFVSAFQSIGREHGWFLDKYIVQ